MLQVLYGWDMTGEGPVRDWARQALRGRRVSARYRPYIDRLIKALDEQLPECDSRIEACMPNWRLDRLSAIDRNILRIGTVEILTIDDVPPRVAIHEAIRLADLSDLYQEDAAKKMNISRQTFGNIIRLAHKKIADALLNAKALKIEGV